MSPAAEIVLVAQRELRKNVRSAKGLALLALSLLGGVVVALVLAWLDKMKREKLAGLSADQYAEAQKQIIMALGDGDEALGDALAKTPGALLGALKVTVWVGVPALVALLGFDAISGELQHRTVRYWTVRTRRVSFYVGKVLGLWAVVAAQTLIVHAFIWGILIARGEEAGAIVEWGPRLWAVSLPISLVWCAIAQLVGSQFRVPILSLLVIFGSFFVLWIAFIAGASGKAPPLLYLFPSAFDMWLVHPHPDRFLEGLGICLLSAGIYVAAGSALFARRDV